MTKKVELSVTGAIKGRIFPRYGNYGRIEQTLLTCKNCEEQPGDVMWPVNAAKKAPVRLHNFDKYGTVQRLVSSDGKQPRIMVINAKFYKCHLCGHSRQWG